MIGSPCVEFQSGGICSHGWVRFACLGSGEERGMWNVRCMGLTFAFLNGDGCFLLLLRGSLVPQVKLWISRFGLCSVSLFSIVMDYVKWVKYASLKPEVPVLYAPKSSQRTPCHQ